ncbi:phytoene/squalene synthase family protein [Marivita sp. S6314]|uniref:15-cis-phytoene synthase n=1 Tax=Marivita sp. S6314 TaxID=2926406 RepID=UPI001FF6ED6B|nr:phytoene/squalene synthase family protein [Marivita sp. S6314]MCK0151287.1 phytoene/squalene synthase family protein [Marivita sp. S6314]
MSSYAADMEACREAIRHGSLSFHMASRVLPASVRDPSLALYAFCRLADDAVDLQQEKAAAVLRLQDRLERIYAGRPDDAAPDRAFARVVEEFEMPRALPDALLEGLAWDAVGRTYQNLSELFDYSARVASAVGVMMCVLMRVRDPHALARACDLGIAMQLTNIARDIGEDSLEGRIYLPLDWLDEAGLDKEAFLSDPKPTKAVRQMARRLVMEANRLYMRSEAGVSALPLSSRTGIYAARYIYAGIGSQVQRAGYDSISTRAHTSKGQKLGWLAVSAMKAATTVVMPKSAVLFARSLPETQFLVHAAGRNTDRRTRSDTIIEALSQVAQHERNRQNGLIDTTGRLT